jgi:hypothetical protein
MPFYIIHAGTTLQKSDTGGVLSGVTLPAGVTISNERPARMAILANKIVVVNAPSVNLFIDPFTARARVLSIPGPSVAPSVVAGNAGSFDGPYRFYFTYAILDPDGDILTESPASPIAGPVTLSNRQASLSNISTSSTADVNARIVYMTVAEGSDFFEADRITNNTATTDVIDSSDFDLGLLSAANPKGNPPGFDATDRLRLIVAWKDRLFASPLNNPDFVYVSGNRAISNWAEFQRFTVKIQGEDEFGVTGFMARRDELVIGKRRKLVKIIGNDPSDFEQILIIGDIGGVGIISQEAALVIRDECYFLGEDGFYKYGNEGLVSLSRDDVHPWFATGTYFNRAKFVNAFAYHNQKFDTIHLHLAAAGSDDLDRWVRYDMKQKKWFGPDKTDAFVPSAGGAMDDENSFNHPILASDAGGIYRMNATTASDDSTAIEFDVIGKFHSADSPDIEKYWGQPAIIIKGAAAGVLDLIPTLVQRDQKIEDAVAQSTISIDYTKGRARPRRLGTGRMCQLRFVNAEVDQDIQIYGYEIPVHELGRR